MTNNMFKKVDHTKIDSKYQYEVVCSSDIFDIFKPTDNFKFFTFHKVSNGSMISIDSYLDEVTTKYCIYFLNYGKYNNSYIDDIDSFEEAKEYLDLMITENAKRLNFTIQN